jgi:hypothetical protein
MPNSLLTIDMITKEALRLAHEKMSFIGTINRQFDSEFGKSSGKIGDTLRVRLPSQYSRRQGSRVMDVQDAEEQNTSLVTATQDGVDMKFNSRELSLDLENFSKQHLEPAMAALVSGIDSDVIQGCTKLTYNLAGTAGTPPADLASTGAARAKLNQNLAPKDGNRFIQMDSVTMGGLVNGLKGLFQDSTQIKKQYREGMVGRTAMADFYENERVWTMTNGADVVGAINQASFSDGMTTMTIDGMTAAPTVGSVFTIADVYQVHPETKAAYSHLQQFTVTADTTPTTTAISFSPAIYFNSGTNYARQSVDAIPVDSAALTFVGSLSTGYVQNLMYHKDAFTFASAALPMMADAAKCSVQTYDDLSIRCWQASDIRNDEMLTRIDILYGYAAIRPQWASRITS